MEYLDEDDEMDPDLTVHEGDEEAEEDEEDEETGAEAEGGEGGGEGEGAETEKKTAEGKGEADTLARMNSDFLYPQISDRRSIGEWQDDGAADSWQRAHDRVRSILAAPARAVIAPPLAAELETCG